MTRNKRRRRKRLTKSSSSTKIRRQPTDRLWDILFWVVLLFVIIMLIYKADYTGMSHDESKSFARYSKDVYTATHSFDSTNNHILNSIFMHYAHSLFRSYEQFIRIPSMAAGISFMLAVSYIIRKTVRSKALRIVSLLLVCFSGSYYGYLFMARGYAYALGSFALYIAVVLFLLSHKIRFRYWFMVTTVLSYLNFIAVGSLLSSVLIMAAINGVFILLYSPKIFRYPSSRLKPAIVMFLSILCTTSVMLHFLFRAVYDKLFSLENNYDLVALTKKWEGWPSLVLYLKTLLIRNIFVPNTVLGKVVLYISLCAITISLLFYVYRIFQSCKSRETDKFFSNVQSFTFPLASTFLSIIVLFVYGVLLGRCPGLVRSNILLIPLVILSAIGLLDWFVQTILDGRYRQFLNIFVIALIVTIFLRTAPSFNRPKAILMSKPVLTRLTAYDPGKVWNISFCNRSQKFFIKSSKC